MLKQNGQSTSLPLFIQEQSVTMTSGYLRALRFGTSPFNFIGSTSIEPVLNSIPARCDLLPYPCTLFQGPCMVTAYHIRLGREQNWKIVRRLFIKLQRKKIWQTIHNTILAEFYCPKSS